MNKDELQDLIMDIELLYKYSEFIPNSYKSSYSQNLDNIKNKLDKFKANIPKLKISNKSENIQELSKPDYKSIRTFLPDGVYTEIFYDVIDSIIPYSENEDKKSLKELFLSQDRIFLDFIEYYQNQDEKNDLNFKKNKLEIANRGWIKLGEILTNSSIITSDNLKKALDYQGKKPDLFIGESLIELGNIKEIALKKALKCQRWLFKICEKSELL